MAVDTNVICHEYRDYLRRYIAKRVGNKEDVEDLLQDVFVIVQNNVSGIREQGAIKAWISQITRNQIVDYYRSRKPTELLDDNIPDNEAESENANREISICVRNMIKDLPAKYQQVIKLTTYQGLNQKQVAQQLGLSLSGAKSRVQRSRVLIKKMLQRCCQLEIDRVGNIIGYKQKGKIKYC